MYRYNNNRKQGFLRRHRRMLVPVALVVMFLLVALAFYLVSFGAEDTSDDAASVSENTTGRNDTETAEEPLDPLPSVQDELDQWLATSTRGTHAIMLEDPETGEVLAQYREDEQYFTASIYKLYVAYLGLIDIQMGKYEPNEVYNQGRSRQQCIVEMVRDSDSPCAEQMWAEQDREVSTQRLVEFGFTNTSMVGLQTTVRDANVLMTRLQKEQDLNEAHTALLREALQTQIYREAIPSAVPNLEVYNKVGFYETGWLDVSIITLPGGREVVLSIYTDSAGDREVASLTSAIMAPLLEY